MLQQPKNWQEVKASAERVALPVGAYLCKILGAKVADYTDKTGNQYSKLEMAFDITEGEYAGHFQRDFDAQTQEDKKWKGVLRQYIAKDDGTQQDEWTKSNFKAMVDAVEESNVGYHFDWDEKSLKGKAVGCLFRNTQWVMDGKSGWKAQPFKFLPTDRVRSGKFTIPADLKHKNAPVNIDIVGGNADSFAVVADDEDLPF